MRPTFEAPSVSSPLLAALALCLAAFAGCTLVSGVDDYKFASGGAAASTSTGTGTPSASTGATGSSSSATAGSGGGCGATAKLCGSCVGLNDPLFGCDSASCNACAAGSTCCPSCTDTSKDPLHCGDCATVCAGAQWCSGGCECRPGLMLVQGNCIDPSSDPQHCGATSCSGTNNLCQAGSCVADCNQPYSECNNACVDKMRDPLHCGSCSNKCATNEVCVTGTCRPYAPAAGCSTCPCPACTGGFDRCCTYPKSSTPICVTQAAGDCP